MRGSDVASKVAAAAVNVVEEMVAVDMLAVKVVKVKVGAIVVRARACFAGEGPSSNPHVVVTAISYLVAFV